MIFIPTQDYFWNTEYFHMDNAFTMRDFLNNHLPEIFKVTLIDGSYCEILDLETGFKYAVGAKGNGDSYNHVVTSGLLK